jgi:hypothetical protein
METKRIPKRKKKKEETNPTVYQYSGITTLRKDKYRRNDRILK